MGRYEEQVRTDVAGGLLGGQCLDEGLELDEDGVGGCEIVVQQRIVLVTLNHDKD